MTVANHGSWTLGTIVGTVIAALLLLAAAAGLVLGVFGWLAGRKSKDRREREDAKFSLKLAAGAVAAAVVVTGVYVGTMWPLDGAFHQWRSTSGVVESVASRQVSNGEHGMETKYVVKYVDGGQRGCLDTRCALVKPGDTLTLKCKKQWQWSATPGFDCNYVSRNGDAGE